MRISHLYPVTLLVVVIILGVAGYMRWHVNSSSTTADSYQTATSSMSTSTAAASAALPGTSSSYTAADVSTHATAQSCWTIINGNVYDVTSWINQHPGGAQAILSLCGHDGTAAFTAQHGGQGRPEAELASFKIGTLAQ